MTRGRAHVARLLGALRGPAGAARLVPEGRGILGAAAVLAGLAGALAALALFGALTAGRLAAAWEDGLSGSATLQVIADEGEIEAQARAALEVMRTTPGVRAVRVVGVEEQRALIAPWLGTEVPVDALPMPLMIDVSVEPGAVDAAALAERLAGEAPGAVYDDHGAWRVPLVAGVERARWTALACLALALGALAAGMRLAAHAAVAANAGAIGTLVGLGAEDRLVAGVLARRLAASAGIGAAVGAGLAAAAAIRLDLSAAVPAGAGPAGADWLLAALVPAAAAALAAAVTRGAALRLVPRVAALRLVPRGA